MSIQNTNEAETMPSAKDSNTAASTDGLAGASAPASLTGRAVFVVQTAAEGVMVRSAFLTEDNRLLDMPAIFPELTYALNVVDDLKRQIIEHFAQAAQIGARVIAQQALAQAPADPAADKPVTPTQTPTQTITSDDLTDKKTRQRRPDVASTKH